MRTADAIHTMRQEKSEKKTCSTDATKLIDLFRHVDWSSMSETNRIKVFLTVLKS